MSAPIDPPKTPPRRRAQRWLWAILLLAGVFRFWALDWDQGTFGHPDERHVLMTAHKLGWLASLGEYLDETRSPLNPRNRSTPYFAYGTLPTTLLTGLCEFAGARRLGQQALLGRALSAIFDLGVVWLVFLLGRSLRDDDDETAACRTGLLAALLYALAVLPIQHAHFFVVDPFANFFVALALWRLVVAQRGGGPLAYAGVGVALGLAVACKISVATFALPAALAAMLRATAGKSLPPGAPIRACLADPTQIAARWLAFGGAAALTFHLAEPDAFNGWLTLAPRWLANIREVIAVSQGATDVPFTRQWVNRAPLLFPWRNMVVWGMGIPLGSAAWTGAGWAAWRLIRRREWALLAPVVWIGVVFFYQGTLWQMTMRYFLPIYPPLIALAAWALVRLAEAANLSPRWARWRWTPAGLIVVLTLLWATGFLHIYAGGHTRVRASRWIYAHIPQGAALGAEHWDESLPLPLPDTPGPQAYHIVEFPWYDSETEAKREMIFDRLNQTDFLILASPKLYGSIPRMPHRYPLAIAYYRALFDGSLGFDLVAQFHGTMNVLGWQFPTDSAEEAFSVYDHPRVMIFQKSARYLPQAARALLGSVDLAHVIDSRETAPPAGREASAAARVAAPKTEAAILLDPARWQQQQAGGTWSEIFHRQGFVNRHPVLCWVGLLALLFGIGFPYAFVICTGLPDRGAGLCRLGAISLPLWLLWLLASGETVAFRAGTWRMLLDTFAVGALCIVWRRRAEMRDFLRREWRLLLAGELIFWVAFAACLIVRCLNPDLWHRYWGGEKPMEMTYLYGVMKSEHFPPYNPWYAGGFINYYYFGFVLTGGLIKGMGVLPEMGFNLCLATFYGLTASAAFAVARALTARCASIWPAIGGSVFVSLLGNLYQAKFFYLRLVELGKSDHEFTVPFVSDAIRAAYGMRHVWRDHQPWFVYVSDPYWAAGRAIPVKQPGSVPPITEFPCWSFVYADLHPHVIALPFTIALIGVLCAWLRTESRWTKAALAAAMAFLLGLFWPTNAWDWPTYGALTGMTLFLSHWRQAAGTSAGFLKATVKSVGLFLLILLLGRVAFQPFYHHYVSGYGSFVLWHGERTSLWDYLFIHGFYLFILATAFAVWRQNRRAGGFARACQAWALWQRQQLPGGNPKLQRALSVRFERQPYASFWAGTAFALAGLLTLCLFTRFALPAFLGLGLLFSLILALSQRADPLASMPFLMIALGFALSMLVEFVVLDGDVGRMNTVFKFYYQVWTLFALGAAALLADVWRALPGWQPKWRRAWLTAFGALLALALLYSATAVPAKVADRFARIPPTLDGLAYMNKARYEIQGREFALRGDLLAIRWLQDHVRGTPVVLEMNTGTMLYSWGSRISIHTGLSSIVGWDWHQRQQQAGIASNKVAERIADMQTLYATSDPQLTLFLLKKYHVGLVVVGELERAFAPEEGLRKFDSLGLQRIYDAEGVIIYRADAYLP